MKSLSSYITEALNANVPGTVFVVHDGKIEILTESADNLKEALYDAFINADQEHKEWKLLHGFTASKAHIYGISGETKQLFEVGKKTYYAPETSIQACGNYYLEDFWKNDVIREHIRKFAYEGDLDGLDLVLYTYDKLPGDTYAFKPMNKWGEFNGILIARSKASVSTRNWCYTVDVDSLDREMLVEAYPGMRLGMENSSINGTFVYCSDKPFNVKFSHKLDK